MGGLLEDRKAAVKQADQKDVKKLEEKFVRKAQGEIIHWIRPSSSTLQSGPLPAHFNLTNLNLQCLHA